MDTYCCQAPDMDELITHPKQQALVILTCLLMGSKVEELDDYIPFVKHMEKYYSLHLSDQGVVPSWDEIIEFER
jgi:hypothetical protein